MKSIQFLLFIICTFCLSCGTSEDPNELCLNLQASLNEATNDKLVALEAYSMDTSNASICENYAEALRNRIESAQNMIDQNCLTGGALMSTEQAIQEDMDELDGLSC